MKTGYGLNTGDSLGYLGYSSKPYSSLPYSGNSGKGYSSLTSGLKSSKYAGDKDTISGRVKKSKPRKLSASEKIDTPLYKKKTFDFTDYAYREAVNRLKFLLTEAYEPTKLATSIYYRRSGDDGKSEASDSQSVIERPSLTEVSKYFNHGTVSRYGGVGGTTLGTTSHGGNDMALTTAAGGRRYSMLNKDLGLGSPGLKPAVSMASLHPAPSVCSVSQNLEIAQPPPELLGFIEKQETYIEQLEKESQYCREELSTLLKKVKDVVSENEALTDRARSKALYQVDSSESEDLDLDRLRDKGKLSGPNIVFESRISELEAQLAQSQIDLKKLFNENEENKRKLVHGSSDANCTDVYRKQVENLQRDKQSLEESVRKLQLTIDQLKDSEASSFNKSQRSRDMIEQVAFERNQGEIEIRRLKDELERQHERVREVQHEMAKRIAEERSNAERRYTFQVDQLGGDLSSQWEQSTKLQLEVERMRRIESDYKREINQKNSQLDELKLELKNKTAIFMSDLNQASAEKQSLEQEITSLRLQLERAERQTKVEVSRLTAECTSLRQRLDRADADLLHSKRENLKLSDDIASLEKELTLGDLNKETRPSKELAKIIADMEAKHASTVSELEGMVQDQKQLMEKLTAECKSLTHKLEDTTLRHKQEIDILQNNFDFLSQRIETNAVNAAAIAQDINQYATNSVDNPNDNRYSTTDYASSNRPNPTNYASYSTPSAAADSVNAAVLAQNYSSPTPKQYAVRDDGKYEGSKSISRPGSTATNYPAPRSMQPNEDTTIRSPSNATKTSRPDSQSSDRQQYPSTKQQPPPELSRNNSVTDYATDSKGNKYADEKRSDSRLSRASVSNEDSASKLQGKESEFGRADTERVSRTSDNVVKPDGTGSSGRLSRESVRGSERASRQSVRYPQPEYGSEAQDQYQPSAAVDPYATQPADMDQSYAQSADQQYQQPNEGYDENAGYDNSQYDPSQQYDQSQYDTAGYANQQYVQESYDQQAYDHQQYQDYQQPYDAQQYTTEQVYDESSYPAGSTQSPTQQQQQQQPQPSLAPAPLPAAASVPLEQNESNRNVGYSRTGRGPASNTNPTSGSANNGTKQSQYKSTTGAANK
ncbi:coiled-coil domain-containing protein 158 isoform X2 [Uranotaenia lowii]|uniref:coiled-coil domain-containing protein 158 isoform X2 n=1 Tax=Uranotaenia lowii TaxID=190385 RepID=UPI0024791D62|nr:coiled-coil domain-containing protein 158 isoform X2 [Uranotaenia lowii]